MRPNRHEIPLGRDGRAILHLVGHRLPATRNDLRAHTRRTVLSATAFFGVGAFLGYIVGLLSGFILGDPVLPLRHWEQSVERELTEQFTAESKDEL